LALNVPFFSTILYPGNLFTEWGTYNPPSVAPLRHAKTLFPVVVLVKPTSKIALNGFFFYLSDSASAATS